MLFKSPWQAITNHGSTSLRQMYLGRCLLVLILWHQVWAWFLVQHQVSIASHIVHAWILTNTFNITSFPFTSHAWPTPIVRLSSELQFIPDRTSWGLRGSILHKWWIRTRWRWERSKWKNRAVYHSIGNQLRTLQFNNCTSPAPESSFPSNPQVSRVKPNGFNVWVCLYYNL